MLTRNLEEPVESATSKAAGKGRSMRDAVVVGIGRIQLSKLCTIEWLGQTVASLCWIVSMLAYGISSSGDWLQLMAASAWFVANVASLNGYAATGDTGEGPLDSMATVR